MLQWLRERKCEWDWRTRQAAKEYPGILKWVDDNGIPPKEAGTKYAPKAELKKPGLSDRENWMVGMIPGWWEYGYRRYDDCVPKSRYGPKELQCLR